MLESPDGLDPDCSALGIQSASGAKGGLSARCWCLQHLQLLLPELVASMLLQDNDYVEIFAGAGEVSGRLRQARYYAL